MSIMMNMSWAGVSTQDYERLHDVVRWREQIAPGGRYHIAWPTDAGLRVVDVWESADHFDEFVGTRLMPGVQQLGLPGEPDVAVWPLYDLQIEGDPGPECVVADGTGEGMPMELYQRVERVMNWKQHPPQGAVVHIVGLDGDTIRDVGVWRSAASIEAFATGPFAKTLDELGVEGDIADEPVSSLHAWLDPTKVRTG